MIKQWVQLGERNTGNSTFHLATHHQGLSILLPPEPKLQGRVLEERYARSYRRCDLKANQKAVSNLNAGDTANFRPLPLLGSAAAHTCSSR